MLSHYFLSVIVANPFSNNKLTAALPFHMLCLVQKRKNISLQPLQGDVSYADYVSVVSQLSSPEVENQICHWDIATLVDSSFVLEYSPEQYPLLSLTREGVQLVLNVAGKGAFSTSCINTAVEFSAHLLEALTVRGYEPEYEVKLLQSNNPTEN